MKQITNGTEKQNSYATDLRQQFLDGCDSQLEFARRPGWESDIPRLERAKAIAARINDVRFWLDHGRSVRWNFSRVLGEVLERG